MVNKLIQTGDKNIKITLEALLRDESIKCPIDEQIVYNQLDYNNNAVWSLLLACGYLNWVKKIRNFLHQGNVLCMNWC